MYILGISAYFHDSAAALLKDGELICAFEEERFTRVKHDNSFPSKAAKACLAYGGISIEEVSHIAYYEKPLRKFERILETFARTYPRTVDLFARTISEWSSGKLAVENTIRKELGYTGEVRFYPHHLSHAAAAYYTSPYEDAAVLVVDGVGEYETTSLWTAEKGKLKLLDTIQFPNSLGLLYSTITAFLGFRVNNDEYKVMGLAAYGKPTHTKELYSLVRMYTDGSFALRSHFFAFEYSERMWSKRLEKLIGTPREPHEEIEQRHKDIAHSLQKVTEEVYMRLLRELHRRAPAQNVCVGGGVALNVVANGKIKEETPFKNAHIFGPAGDSGAAVGAALLAHSEVSKEALKTRALQLTLGSEYSDMEIKKALEKSGCAYSHMSSEEELLTRIAQKLREGMVVAWFQDRMEFGPRALGSRSILAHPGAAGMKDKLNKIKGREGFRPFALSILQETTKEVFGESIEAPHMNMCLEAQDEHKEGISAVVHEDGTTRVQTVDERNGKYFRLIKEFERQCGLPCVLNTSFNIAGEPIVESPQQAIESFKKSKLDVLAIGNFLVRKK